MYTRIWKLPDWGVDAEVYQSAEVPKQGIIAVRRTDTQHDKTIIGKTSMWEWKLVDSDKPTSSNPLIAVLAEDHPQYTFWDYDTKPVDGVPTKQGKELFELHDWNGAYTYTTKSGGYRVITEPADVAIHPYKHTEYGDALEVFNAPAHRWIAIPPTAGYGTPRGTVGRPIELNLPKQEVVQPSPTIVWTPKRVQITLPYERTYRRAQHSDSPAVTLCDAECGPFYRKTKGEWIQVSRHGELLSMTHPLIAERIAKRQTFGPHELNELFSLFSHFNDEWHCASHGQKFANDEYIVQDILRILTSKGAKFYNSDLSVTEYVEILYGFAMREAHEFLINGPKRGGKSRLATLIARAVSQLLNGRVAYLTRDEGSSQILLRDPTAFVISKRDARAGNNLHSYVFERGITAMETFERFVSVLPSDAKVIVIEPATPIRIDYGKKFKITDDYTAAYDSTEWILDTAGMHTILSYHVRKPPNESKSIHHLGGAAALGTVGIPASTRFGVNIDEDHTVSFWGNNHPDEWVENRWALVEHIKDKHYSLVQADFEGETILEENITKKGKQL